MGTLKEQQLKEDDQHKRATDIAIRAGVLSYCGCSNETIIKDGVDDAAAYKLGYYEFRNNVDELEDVFESEKQMRKLIGESIDEYKKNFCSLCN